MSKQHLFTIKGFKEEHTGELEYNLKIESDCTATEYINTVKAILEDFELRIKKLNENEQSTNQ